MLYLLLRATSAGLAGHQGAAARHRSKKQLPPRTKKAKVSHRAAGEQS